MLLGSQGLVEEKMSVTHSLTLPSPHPYPFSSASTPSATQASELQRKRPGQRGVSVLRRSVELREKRERREKEVAGA